jgi:hypothetical protein
MDGICGLELIFQVLDSYANVLADIAPITETTAANAANLLRIFCFFIVNSSQLRDRLFASSSTKRVSSRRQLGTFASNVPFALGMPAFLIAPARIEPRTLSKAFFFILSYSLIGNALLVVVDGFNLAQPEIDS